MSNFPPNMARVSDLMNLVSVTLNSKYVACTINISLITFVIMYPMLKDGY